MAARWNRAGHYIFMLWFLSSVYLSIFFFFSPDLSGRYHTLTHGVALVRSSARLAENAAPKKIAKNWRSAHHHTTLSGYILATKAHIDNRKKNLLSTNISSTCPHNMVNFGPLAAEIGPVVWGTPANFNGFRVLVALLHGTVL